MASLPAETEVLRLLVAAALAGFIGWERETHQRPAGLRTHMLVAVGSTLIMLVSQDLFLQYRGMAQADPARIAAQVVSGIGFLGAGTILREGPTVRGLTTAASLWVAAAIGLAVGAGAILGALVTTAVTLGALVLLARLERRMQLKERHYVLRLQVQDLPGQLGRIGLELGRRQVNIRQIAMHPAEDEGRVEMELLVQLPAHLGPAELADALRALDGVRGLDLGPPA